MGTQLAPATLQILKDHFETKDHLLTVKDTIKQLIWNKKPKAKVKGKSLPKEAP